MSTTRSTEGQPSGAVVTVCGRGVVRRWVARELAGLRLTPRGRLAQDAATAVTAAAALLAAVLLLALVMPGA